MAGLIIAWQREQREAESINSAEVAPGRLAGTRQTERERERVREEKGTRGRVEGTACGRGVSW